MSMAEDDGREPERKGEELMKKLMPGPDTKITSVTIGIGRRCPHCGQLPEDFRESFERRVQEEYIVPEKSKHLSGHSDGTVFAYVPDKDCISPKGLYPAVIVPRRLIGKIVLIKEKTEEDKDAKKRADYIEILESDHIVMRMRAESAEASLEEVKKYARDHVCGKCAAEKCEGCPISADGGK